MRGTIFVISLVALGSLNAPQIVCLMYLFLQREKISKNPGF